MPPTTTVITRTLALLAAGEHRPTVVMGLVGDGMTDAAAWRMVRTLEAQIAASELLALAGQPPTDSADAARIATHTMRLTATLSVLTGELVSLLGVL